MKHLTKELTDMKIAIHHRPGSFSDRWIEYCEQQGVDYKIVNAYEGGMIRFSLDPVKVSEKIVIDIK